MRPSADPPETVKVAVGKMIPDLAVIIVAGGSALRFGGDKLMVELGGLPVFLHSVREFLPVAAPGSLVVVHPAGRGGEFRAVAERYLPGVGIVWAEGGACRSASVRSGLARIPLAAGIVAVHDAARPLASAGLLVRLVAEARRNGGAIPGKPVTDTLKRCGETGLIEETIPRSGLWRVETPQVFDLEKLRAAYERAPEADLTDDACVYSMAGFGCAVVLNEQENLKITYPADIALLKRRECEAKG